MLKKYTFSQILETLKNTLKPDSQLVFDCDGTLIEGDVSALTGWHLLKSGLVNPDFVPTIFQKRLNPSMSLIDYDAVVRQVEAEKGVSHALEWEVLIQSGVPEDVVIREAQKAITDGLEKKRVCWTPHLPKLAAQFLDQSWVVSGSSFPTVFALVKKLGFVRERVLATRLETVDGIYQQQFLHPGFVWLETKVQTLAEAGVKEIDFVAGDSVGDVPMLSKASKVCWFVLWNKKIHRPPLRDKMQDFFPHSKEIPIEEGLYLADHGGKLYVFEVASSAL